MKICVVGNCQSKQIKYIIKESGNTIDIVETPENYLATESDRQIFDAAYKTADVVFIQRSTYPEFCTPGYARQFCRNTISWPVIYFDGYFPDIGYFRVKNNFIQSILGGYHSKFIRRLYLAGATPEDAHVAYTGKQFANEYAGSFEKSIDNLRAREGECDVIISDYVSEKCRERQLFYTINHPDNITIITLIRRLFNCIGENVAIAENLRELDESKFPSNAFLLKGEGALFNPATEYLLTNVETGEMRPSISIMQYINGLYKTYSEFTYDELASGAAL